MLLGSALVARLLYILTLFLCSWHTFKLLQKHRRRGAAAGVDSSEFLRDGDAMLRRWVLLAAVAIWETYAESIASILPLYWEAKVATLIAIAGFAPDAIFDGFLDPAVKRLTALLLPRGAGHIVRRLGLSLRVALESVALALPPDETDAWRVHTRQALDAVRAELVSRRAAGGVDAVALRGWQPSAAAAAGHVEGEEEAHVVLSREEIAAAGPRAISTISGGLTDDDISAALAGVTTRRKG